MPDQKAPPDPTPDTPVDAPAAAPPDDAPKKKKADGDTCAFCEHAVDMHNRFALETGTGQCEVCACRGVVLTG